jgi:hypothetical protein
LAAGPGATRRRGYRLGTWGVWREETGYKTYLSERFPPGNTLRASAQRVKSWKSRPAGGSVTAHVGRMAQSSEGEDRSQQQLFDLQVRWTSTHMRS